jgi:hypothetical protein
MEGDSLFGGLLFSIFTDSEITTINNLHQNPDANAKILLIKRNKSAPGVTLKDIGWVNKKYGKFSQLPYIPEDIQSSENIKCFIEMKNELNEVGLTILKI